MHVLRAGRRREHLVPDNARVTWQERRAGKPAQPRGLTAPASEPSMMSRPERGTMIEHARPSSTRGRVVVVREEAERMERLRRSRVLH